MQDKITRVSSAGVEGGTVRPCSFVRGWWIGTIPNRIISLIYIDFD
jgi:hypothetical protein